MDSWSLEIALVIRRLHEDPEIVWGPRGFELKYGLLEF